jgi:hypothetical protein
MDIRNDNQTPGPIFALPQPVATVRAKVYTGYDWRFCVTVRILTAMTAICWSFPAWSQAVPGSIAGQVLDDKTGAPVRFATVVLTGPVSQDMLAPATFCPSMYLVPPSTPPKRVEITADELGHFTFSGVAPGNYAVGAHRDGYTPSLHGPTHATRELVTVKENGQVGGIDIRMPPCGVIAGKVVNENGEPVQNVEMVALRYYYGAWMWRPPVAPDTPLKAYTNDLGEFRIANLAEGSYIVRAAAPPQARARKAAPSYPAQFYPNALSPEAAQPIAVTGAAVSQAQFTLQPGPAYHISGTIDSHGASQEFCFGLAPKRYNSSLAQVIGRVVRCCGNGAFTIDDVPPGSYVLSAVACHASPRLGAVQAIEVGGNVEGLNVELTSGRPVSGVVKSEGVDVSGIQLALYSPELLLGFVPRTAIGTDGSFVFDHVLPRHHIVGFSGLPAGAYVKSVKYDGREVPSSGFEIAGDAAIEITLARQGAARLAGSVLDKSGNPAPYAMVMALPADDGPAESARDLMADEKGNFTFSALRPGAYKVLAWEVRYNAYGVVSADPALPMLFETNARTVTLSAGAPSSVSLTLNTQEDVNRARAAAGLTPPNTP